MRKQVVAVLALLSGILSASAQTTRVHVKLRVVLIDKDLNQKPVPFAVVRLKSGSAAAVEAKTDLSGTALVQIVAGHYTVTTANPAELGGKKYTWSVESDIRGAEQEIDLTNDNAKIENGEAGAAKAENAGATDLTALFGRLKNSIVTVRSEAFDGSGFLVDSSGLIVTNNHVVESSKYLAVQFDQKRKVPAQLIVANRDKDVAILWVNPAAFPESVVAPIISTEANSAIAVGQQVFTIGNPLGREKVLTTGVISKVDQEAITSDININPGNSGGPLFTMRGQVVGITTAGLRTLASIVPIEPARPLLEEAKKTINGAKPPAASLLPVEPADYFPPDYLRGLLSQQKIDTRPYFFDLGQFQVAFITPPLSYFLRHIDDMAAARKAVKRAGGDPAQAKPPAEALADALDFKPVVMVSVRPKLGVLFKMKFKNGFQSMRLLCGGKELAPIDPGRSEYELDDERGRAMDTTFQGRYSYMPDAISPACGSVVLEVYSEKEPNTAVSKTVDAATIERVWADLEPYRKMQAPK
jgi:S1-C subfamily serine protease